MLTIEVRNVHQALPEGMRLIQRSGYERSSRNGACLQLPEPLSTHYARPQERVVFWAKRDANPFFHLFEALWMLAGRSDVAFPARFARHLRTFSDDGTTFHGAYGWRWRAFFGRDQLNDIVDSLKRDPTCRRQVLAMWDATHDLMSDSKDLPCNTHAYVQLGATGRLNLLVSNRSNDLVWGAYGANAVHFSVLLEYLAARIGVGTGTYHQVSMNSHVYAHHYELMKELADEATDPPTLRADPYSTGAVGWMPLVRDPAQFDKELYVFVNGVNYPYKEPFFVQVALPMLQAHDCYSKGDLAGARAVLAVRDHTNDWIAAASEWIERRVDRKLARAQ